MTNGYMHVQKQACNPCDNDMTVMYTYNEVTSGYKRVIDVTMKCERTNEYKCT